MRYQPAKPPLLLNISARSATLGSMKKLLTSLALAATITGLASTAASAGCYADYKAKRDNPLKLHYGVIELPDRACGSPAAAGQEIAARIGRDGWVLLSVVSIFGPQGLNDQKRVESAGAYFLRY